MVIKHRTGKIIPPGEINENEIDTTRAKDKAEIKLNSADIAELPNDLKITIPLLKEDGSGTDEAELKLTFRTVAQIQQELKITFPGVLQGVGAMDFEVINAVVWACVLHSFPQGEPLPTVDAIAERIPLDEFDNVSQKVEKLLRKAFPKLFAEIDEDNIARKNLIRQIQEENLRKTLGIGDILSE